MRVMLISANTETINMPTPPMGLACVAAATEAAGHEVRFVDLLGKDDALCSLEADLSDFRPEVVGVSIRNIDDQNMAEPRFLLESTQAVVALCKGLSGAPVVLGGAGYSLFPQSALAFLGADMGVQGEGEAAFPMLLDRLAVGGELDGVPGLHVQGEGCKGKRGYETHLDRFALPDPALFPVQWAPKSPVLAPGPDPQGVSPGLQLLFHRHHRGPKDSKPVPGNGCSMDATDAKGWFRAVLFCGPIPSICRPPMLSNSATESPPQALTWRGGVFSIRERSPKLWWRPWPGPAARA